MTNTAGELGGDLPAERSTRVSARDGSPWQAGE